MRFEWDAAGLVRERGTCLGNRSYGVRSRMLIRKEDRGTICDDQEDEEDS